MTSSLSPIPIPDDDDDDDDTGLERISLLPALPPWLQRPLHQSQSYTASATSADGKPLNLMRLLRDELIACYDYMRPTEQEQAARTWLVQRLRVSIQRLFPLNGEGGRDGGSSRASGRSSVDGDSREGQSPHQALGHRHSDRSSSSSSSASSLSIQEERRMGSTNGERSAVEVTVYGSHNSELMLPNSDVNLNVSLVSADTDGDDGDDRYASTYGGASGGWTREQLADRITDMLQRDKWTKKRVVPTAGTQALEFTDKMTGLVVRIRFGHDAGLRATKFMEQHVLQGNQRHGSTMRVLIVFIKLLLRQRSLHSPLQGGLNSYAISLMVLSFMQLHPLLHQYPDLDPYEYCGALLYDFVVLYGSKFDYANYGISVLEEGDYFLKEQPQERLFIEDPIDVRTDVTSTFYRLNEVKNLFQEVERFLLKAIRQNTPESVESLLKEFVPLDANSALVRDRKRLQEEGRRRHRQDFRASGGGVSGGSTTITTSVMHGSHAGNSQADRDGGRKRYYYDRDRDTASRDGGSDRGPNGRRLYPWEIKTNNKRRKRQQAQQQHAQQQAQPQPEYFGRSTQNYDRDYV